MATALQAHRETLLTTIRGVRSRWRWKVVLRSLTVLLGAGVGTMLVAAYGLEQFRFSPAAIITARIVTYLVLAALGWFFFVRPLARRVTDQQVALYLEEHEPSLQELLLSAVDAGFPSHPAAATGESAAMLERLVESAIEKCEDTDLGPRPRAAQSLALRCRDGRHRDRGGRDLHRRPGLPAAGRAGRARARVERRGREPVPHRRAAGERHRRARRGRHGDGDAVGLHGHRGGHLHPRGRRRALRARGDDRERRRRRVRDDLLRPAPVARLFRPGGRRAVLRLQDRGGRTAVRRSAGTRVRVPGLHGPRAAAGRRRRRHRGAARHDGPPPRALDARDEERPRRARRA